MVITSLIFLLLSNSITLRRDKSILYSRATITILLISSFIAYGNLFFLFLNKGTGIFLGLFTRISSTDLFHVFISLVAILTSVISAVYYLAIIKQIFFDKPDYKINNELTNLHAEGIIAEKSTITTKASITINNIVLSSSLSLSISIITLVVALFIFIPEELLNLANILALILFNI